MIDHNKKFETLPDDGATRYILICSDKDKTPESYGMFGGWYFNGDFQWAAQWEYAHAELVARQLRYPQYDWEIYELLPNR